MIFSRDDGILRSPDQPIRWVLGGVCGANLEALISVSNVFEDPMTDSGRPTAVRPRPPRALRVLVVDGEPLIRWALAKALEGCGDRVVAAADGDAALHALAGGGFDAALLDCPPADDWDLTLLDSFRAISPDLPVVGMTACPSEEMRRRARGHGARWILEKPFDVFSLDRVLRDVCTRQHLP